MRRATALFLLLLATCAAPYPHNEQCAIGEVERQSTQLAEPRHDIEGLPNFAEISPGLYRSGQPTAEGFAQAKKLGIKTILNLRWGASDREELQGLGLKYYHISFNPWIVDEDEVVEFLQIVMDPTHQPVLVHCQRGADRTGMMVAVYRHLVQSWPMERAKKEMGRFDFHPMFENMIDYLDCVNCPQLREKIQNRPAPQVETIP